MVTVGYIPKDNKSNGGKNGGKPDEAKKGDATSKKDEEEAGKK